MDQPSIHSKRELFDFFQGSILGAYRELLENKRLYHENNLLKTYLLENDIGEKQDPTYYIKNNFLLTDGNKQVKPKVKVLDNDLIRIYYGDNIALYIDISDKRIWNIHSLADSKFCDKIIRRAAHSTYFDFVWLNHSFLKKFQSIGISRGFGLDYDYEKFYSDDIAPSLKMQISGKVNFDRIYSALDSISELKDQVTLSKIKIKSFDVDDNSQFILQDIKYNGKITARGSDIDQHLLNIQKLKTEYFSVLKIIEDKYRITWNDDNNLRLDGSVIHIIKQGEKMNLDLLAEKLFDGSAPFKLLGIPEEEGDGLTVEVLDLHIGNTFTIDLYEDKFVIYLRDEVCGNTILRFITNLQHSYSNSFKVQNEYGEEIFEA